MVSWIDDARKQREWYGEKKYGVIDPKNDPRCFRRELVEELLDALNYAEWAMASGEISPGRFIQIRDGIVGILESLKGANPCPRLLRLLGRL